MKPIHYIDRRTGRQETEQVFGARALSLAYGNAWYSAWIQNLFLPLLTQFPYFSRWYGWLQTRPTSRKNIQPFVEQFGIDLSELRDPLESFGCFNDFFTRRLKLDARPIAQGDRVTVIPADGRYLFYPAIQDADLFSIKGELLSLSTLVGDPALASNYRGGSLVIARLCPVDYHRFHFPFDCTPGEAIQIPGRWDSVNPWALDQCMQILQNNVRYRTILTSRVFGQVLYLEVGALCVASVQQTYTPEKKVKKGEEKGFFQFGGSTLLLLFPPNTITFCSDLLDLRTQGMEIYCRVGQPMGTRDAT